MHMLFHPLLSNQFIEFEKSNTRTIPSIDLKKEKKYQDRITNNELKQRRGKDEINKLNEFVYPWNFVSKKKK